MVDPKHSRPAQHRPPGGAGSGTRSTGTHTRAPGRFCVPGLGVRPCISDPESRVVTHAEALRSGGRGPRALRVPVTVTFARWDLRRLARLWGLCLTSSNQCPLRSPSAPFRPPGPHRIAASGAELQGGEATRGRCAPSRCPEVVARRPRLPLRRAERAASAEPGALWRSRDRAGTMGGERGAGRGRGGYL